MTKNAKIAIALLGGYVLGRTKKAKMAIGLGMFLAGKKLDLDPQRLGKLIANSPALGGLSDQVRNELVDATKSLATQALTKRAAGLADSLAQRTQALDAPRHAQEAADDIDEDEGSENDVGPEKTSRGSSRSASDEPAARRRAPAKKASSSAEGARRASAPARKRAAGTAKSGTAKAAGQRTGAAKKRSSSGTRKSGGGSNG